MSGVKRYYAPGLDFMWRDQKDAPRECIPMVLASDYDKLACMVEVGHKLAMDAACGEIAALEAERDALRAQVGAMRGALERAREVVAFHHVTAGDRFREIELAAIDAALAGSKDGDV